MEFKDIAISDRIDLSFRNPVKITYQTNFNPVGHANLRIEKKLLIADMEIDNNKVAGKFDIKLFVVQKTDIIGICLFPDDFPLELV